MTFVASEPFPAPEGEAAKNAPPRKLVLRQLDLDDRHVTTLATIPFPTSGSHVWTSRGTLLMASGHTIYEWNPAHPDDWPKAAEFDNPELQGLTRIALSPRGDRIALVSTPRDETIIRDSRAASNQALAAHNADAFAEVLKDDVIVTAASGKLIQGRATVKEEIEARWKKQPDLVFVRTPATIVISTSDPAASERGTWTGHAHDAGWPRRLARRIPGRLAQDDRRRRHAIVDHRLRVVRRARLQRRGVRAAVRNRERRPGAVSALSSFQTP